MPPLTRTSRDDTHAQDSNRDQGAFHALTSRYLLALGLVALLALTPYLGLRQILQQQADSATLINVSGRQRMLSQRAAFFAVTLATTTDPHRRAPLRAQLLVTVATLDRDHVALIDGDAARHLPAPSPALRALYDGPPLSLDRRVRAYSAAIHALAAEPDARLTPRDPHLRAIQAAASGPVLRALDAVVTAYQGESDATVRRIQTWEMAALAAMLGTLLAEALLIFRPLVRRLRRNTDRLERTLAVNQRVERRLALQYTITRLLVAATTLDDAIPAVLATICAHLGWHIGAFWVVDAGDGADVLRCRTLWQPPEPDADSVTDSTAFLQASQHATFRRGVGLPGRVWAARTSSWVRDVGVDANFPRAPWASHARLHGAFCFPILADGAVYGVMEFFSRDVLIPDTDRADAMVAIGGQVGQFVDRLGAAQALRHQATHDPLTDLPNRAALGARLDQALRDAERTDAPLALFLLDLTRFKEVNDTLGHHVGDALLRQVAARVQGALRGA